MSPGDAFSDSVDPVTVEGDGEDVLKVLLDAELGDGDAAPIEPALDE